MQISMKCSVAVHCLIFIHEAKGIAGVVLPYLYEEKKLCSTLLISPPGCGKTTLLRDIIRMVSDGNRLAGGMTVGVVDERSELAGLGVGMEGLRSMILECGQTF